MRKSLHDHHAVPFLVDVMIIDATLSVNECTVYVSLVEIGKVGND